MGREKGRGRTEEMGRTEEKGNGGIGEGRAARNCWAGGRGGSMVHVVASAQLQRA